MKLPSLHSLILALIVAAAALPSTIAAQTPTVITSLPYEITRSGLYVLNSNLSSGLQSTNLILVSANNVTIDFQGHFISGPVNNTSQTTIGVRADERSNLTIKNGTIAYCAQGIYLIGNGSATTNNVGHQIDNMRVTYCYAMGIGILFGPASRITNCQVSQIGYGGASYTYGIQAAGFGTTIFNCVVTTVAGSPGYGLYANEGSFIRQNTVYNCSNGVYGGKYQDNLTSNCPAPYSGGTDAGGNN